jgi:RNA polymerase sigma-70 factor (ECF subfamily)
MRPVPWELEDPALVMQTREGIRVVESALHGLPDRQRQIVVLRDVEGLTAVEVCNILEISETNQRVLLHRGRARIRRALDPHLRPHVLRPVAPSLPGTRSEGALP